MQNKFIRKACPSVMIAWTTFKRKMPLVLYVLFSQGEALLAVALRSLEALVSASGHSQFMAAKADAAQCAE